MRKILFALLALVFIGSFCVGSAMALTAEDIVKTSALEEIQKRGKLLVGMEAGYQPFEMQDEKGNIVGFDVDMAYEMGKAIFGEGGEKKVVLVNTAFFSTPSCRSRHPHRNHRRYCKTLQRTRDTVAFPGLRGTHQKHPSPRADLYNLLLCWIHAETFCICGRHRCPFNLCRSLCG